MPSVLLPNRVLGLSVRGGGVGFPWANLPGGNALHAWDFLNNTARWNSASVGALSNTPGWTFTRASTGYAQNAAGVLLPFASGELRRTDKGVLIEGARTNLCLQSQTFDNASWMKQRTTVSANTTTAPDGTTTADTLIEDGTVTSTHKIRQPITKAASAIQYTASIYFKAKERTFAHLRIANASESAEAGVGVNLSTGALGTPYATTFTGQTATVSALADGWYRVSVTATTDTDTTVQVFANVSTGLTTGDNSYSGDGTSGLYLWGAQLEAAAFPSSYIPTTTASATRAADVLTVPVSGIDYPQSLFAEFERAVDTGVSEGLFQVDSGASTNRALISVSASDTAQVYVRSGAVDQANELVAGSLAVGTVYKIGARIAANDVRHARGGTLGTADTTVTVPATPTTIRFGQETSTNQSFGYLRRCALWTRALQDSELQTVST